jgi:hypothetical protein
VIPQLAFRKRTGSPGRFARPGFVDGFIDEMLGTVLGDKLGGRRSIEDVGEITLVAHSAGFETALAILHQSDDLPVRRVILLDALYDDASQFAQWVTARPGRHLLSIYAGSGPTRRHSRTLARLVRNKLGDDAVALGRYQDLSEELAHRPVVVASTHFRHGEIPKRLLAQVLSDGQVPPIDPRSE